MGNSLLCPEGAAAQSPGLPGLATLGPRKPKILNRNAVASEASDRHNRVAGQYVLTLIWSAVPLEVQP